MAGELAHFKPDSSRMSWNSSNVALGTVRSKPPPFLQRREHAQLLSTCRPGIFLASASCLARRRSLAELGVSGCRDCYEGPAWQVVSQLAPAALLIQTVGSFTGNEAGQDLMTMPTLLSWMISTMACVNAT